MIGGDVRVVAIDEQVVDGDGAVLAAAELGADVDVGGPWDRQSGMSPGGDGMGPMTTTADPHDRMADMVDARPASHLGPFCTMWWAGL